MSIDFNVFQFASMNNCWFDENGLLHVRGIKKNKEINYKCPFCYETYNKNGNPRKNSKNFTHIHGIDNNILKNTNKDINKDNLEDINEDNLEDINEEIRDPHCSYQIKRLVTKYTKKPYMVCIHY